MSFARSRSPSPSRASQPSPTATATPVPTSSAADGGGTPSAAALDADTKTKAWVAGLRSRAVSSPLKPSPSSASSATASFATTLAVPSSHHSPSPSSSSADTVRNPKASSANDLDKLTSPPKNTSTPSTGGAVPLPPLPGIAGSSATATTATASTAAAAGGVGHRKSRSTGAQDIVVAQFSTTAAASTTNAQSQGNLSSKSIPTLNVIADPLPQHKQHKQNDNDDADAEDSNADGGDQSRGSPSHTLAPGDGSDQGNISKSRSGSIHKIPGALPFVKTVSKGVHLAASAASGVSHGIQAGVSAVTSTVGTAGKLAISTAAVPFQKTSQFVTTRVLGDSSLFLKSYTSEAAFHEADSQAAFVVPIPEVEEPKEDEEVVPPQPEVKRRTVPIKSSPEEFTLYVLALRCFLHPVLKQDPSKDKPENWIGRLTFGLSDHLDVLRPSSSRLSAAQIVALQRNISQELSSMNSASSRNVDITFIRSLRKFNDRIRFDVKDLRANAKDTSDDFRNMFKEILRIETARKEASFDQSLFDERMKRFEEVARFEKRGSSNDKKPPAYESQLSGDLEAEPQPSGSVELLGQDSILQKIFGTSPEEHQKIVETEQFVLTEKVIIDELKARIRDLEAHPFYNKDSFVQKTAAFIKWKTIQEQTIQAVLTGMGVVVEEEKKVEPPPPPIAPAADAKGKLVIDIIRARDLLGKDKDGFSDPYCLVECEGEIMKTATIEKNLNPTWEEQCVFDVKPKPGQTSVPVKITVWDEDKNESKGLFNKKIIHNLLDDNKDDFLGLVNLDLKLDELRRYRIERWFKLEKRSKRSHVNGDIFLRIKYMSSEQQQLQQQQQLAQQQQEKEQLLKQQQQEHIKHSHDYHKLYKVLVDYIFKYEKDQYLCRPAKKRGVFKISALLESFLNEFGFRYGVGELFRTLVWFERTSQEFAHDTFDVLAVSYAMFDLNNVIAERDTRFTIQEQSLLADTLDLLEATFLKRLSMYKDYFPFSTPPGFLRRTIRGLAIVYSHPVFRERHVHAKDLPKMINWCISNCCTTMYERFNAMSAPMIKPDNPAVAAADRICTMVDYILRDIDSDAVYFREDFTVFDGSRVVNVDLVAATIAHYGKLLYLEVEAKINKSFSSGAFHPQIFQIYQKLYKFNAKNLTLLQANTEALVDFQGFPLTEMFTPFVSAWLDVSRSKAVEWANAALQSDKFVSISAKELHSSSVVDIFCMFNQFLDFLNDLNWKDPASLCDFKTRLARIFYEVIGAYVFGQRASLQQLISSYESQHVSTETGNDSIFKKSSEKSKISDEISVRLNNLEAARQQLGALYTTMDADGVAAFVMKEISEGGFGETVGGSAVHDRSGSIATLPSTLTLTPSSSSPSGAVPLLPAVDEEARKAHAKKIAKLEKSGQVYVDNTEAVLRCRKPIRNENSGIFQPAIVVYFDYAAETIRKSLTELVDRLLAPLIPHVESTLSHVLDEPGFLSRFFGKSSAVDKPPTKDEVDTIMQPLMKYLSETLTSFGRHLYGDIYGIMAQRAWNITLTAIEKMTAARVYTTLRPLDMLSQGLLMLREFFQSGEKGLADADVLVPQYVIIREVIELLRHRKFDNLPLLYEHCLKKCDSRMQEYLFQVISRQEDKSCREYLKLLRSNGANRGSYNFFSEFLRPGEAATSSEA